MISSISLKTSKELHRISKWQKVPELKQIERKTKNRKKYKWDKLYWVEIVEFESKILKIICWEVWICEGHEKWTKIPKKVNVNSGKKVTWLINKVNLLKKCEQFFYCDMDRKNKQKSEYCWAW
jgi:hypothetical protein